MEQRKRKFSDDNMSDGGGNEANTHPNPDLNSTEDED